MSTDNNVSTFARAICKAVRGGKKSGVLKPYLDKSRSIALCIDPFANIQRVFYAGVPQEAADNMDDDYSEEELATFNAIMKLERGFDKVVDVCAADTDVFLSLIKLVADAAGHARSDDTNKLKFAILEYLYKTAKTGSRFPAELQNERLLSSDSKVLRGFLHIDTADLLCPLRLRNEFDQHPRSFMDQIADGKIEITAEDLPSFLYEDGTVYDPENEAVGLFRGFLLLRVFRHIFTGPTSAMNPREIGGSKNKARIFKITAVTGRMIAYTCLQTYIGLSNMKRWNSSDNLFNLDDFYNNIVSMFEDNAESTWAAETLEWWTEQVPSLRSKSEKKTKIRRHQKTGPSPAQRIAAQLSRQVPKPAPSRQDHEDSDDVQHDDVQDRASTPYDDPDYDWMADKMIDWNVALGVFRIEDPYASSTEPESANEEEHKNWKIRQRVRNKFCQQAEEYEQDEHEGHQKEEVRHEEDELRIEEVRRKEEECRKEMLRKEEEHRKEMVRRKDVLRKKEERRIEEEHRKEGEHRKAERRKEKRGQGQERPRNKVVLHPPATRSALKRTLNDLDPNSDQTISDDIPKAKKPHSSQPASTTTYTRRR